MAPPCAERTPGGHAAVSGYGDANADVHVVGDHPRIHGGGDSGVPFTGTDSGERLRRVLGAVGLLAGGEATGDGADADDGPVARNCFLSYLHPCWPGEEDPAEAAYDDLEPFFDAELRAIGAHVLVPVGDRAVDHVVREYTSRADRIGTDAARLHAREVHGRGWLVVPVAEPGAWTDEQERSLVDRLRTLLSSDYRQISDLGRFQPHADPYYVR